ncbi:hypothetical protein J1N35_026881 [Gossypium stocksii]|uniref:RNase H type-1 domain-containing protein n=1 Tax=Gossypium stocksii TaxID=47602 RepID=A0A9D3ZZN4_9ROSI|nr:hypothetical protein J1N35_026881 [Gossypium stocksii]
MVEVGGLDSGKHSVVVFPKNINQKVVNNDHSLKSTVGSSKMALSGMRKGVRNWGRGITKKHSRILQGNSTRFKNSGSHRILLKESMVQAVENLSALGRGELAFEVLPIFNQQQVGADIPKHPDRSKCKLLWEGFKSVIPDNSIPWLIMGDFNAILSPEDKKSPFTVNHQPLLLSTRPDFGTNKGRPFRFLARWMKHNDFPNFVRDKWNFKDWYFYQNILQSKAIEFFERLYGEVPSDLRDMPNFGVLSQFCEISGHRVSVSKINIFFSKSTGDDDRCQINQLFGFQEVRNLGTYLKDSGITWSCLFGLIAWRIWKNKNLFIFQNIFWDAMEVVKVSSCWARQYKAHLGDSGFVASGGVVWDHDGKRIIGFTHFLGVWSPFKAELWGILDGILILLNKGCRWAIIITDNLKVVQNLEDLDLEDSGIAVLCRTQQLLRSEGEWKIKHIPLDQNLVADRLAKFGLN